MPSRIVPKVGGRSPGTLARSPSDPFGARCHRSDGRGGGTGRRASRQQLRYEWWPHDLRGRPVGGLSGDSGVTVTNSPNAGVVIATWIPSGGTPTPLIESYAPSS